MWPLVQLPGTDFTIGTYYLLHLVSWLTFLIVGLAITRSRPEFRRHWWWLFYGLVVCDCFGAHLLAQLVKGLEANFWGGPLLFVAWTGLYVLARRIRAYPFLDAWAIAFSASQMLSKGACVAAGCCFGRPTDSVLGVTLRASHGDPTRRLPLPIFEASIHLLTIVVLGLLFAKGGLKGRLVMLLGAIYATLRGGSEALRATPAPSVMDGPLSITQFLCLLVFVFSVTYLLLGWVDGRRVEAHPGCSAGR